MKFQINSQVILKRKFPVRLSIFTQSNQTISLLIIKKSIAIRSSTHLFSLLLASLYLIILRTKNGENEFVLFGLSSVVYSCWCM